MLIYFEAPEVNFAHRRQRYLEKMQVNATSCIPLHYDSETNSELQDTIPARNTSQTPNL